MRRSEGGQLEDPKESSIKCKINRIKDVVIQAKIYKFNNVQGSILPRWYTIYLWRVNILTFLWHFTLINFERDSPRADLPRSTTSNGQLTSVIDLSSTSPFDAQIIDRLSSSTVLYGVCSRVFLVVHQDWVSNNALFDLNWAISNSIIF